MPHRLQRYTGIVAAGCACALLLSTGAEAKKRRPEPAPPRITAPPPVIIPPRPYPPLGAPPSLIPPQVGPDGIRETVNARLTPMQTVWNLRSAYNVAALNCLKPEHAEIVVNYRAFLRKNARALTAANRGVDADFRARHGAAFVRPREAYMTRVYNYFAYPATIAGFCDAALAMSRASLLVKPGELPAFSTAELPKLEAVFDSFFRAYDQYRIDAANWDARYAPRPVVAMPGALPTAGLQQGFGSPK
jgi:hypothetical protein